MAEECPVYVVTGKTVCDGSPWQSVARTRRAWAVAKVFCSRADCERDFRSAVRLEIDFLRSLLPKSADVRDARR